MARSITLTLGAGLGADLGPNFNLTTDVGSVTPSTATKSELTAGKSVSVDDLATQVTVTSTGTCTNAITQTIPCAGGTTTTTTTEAPTTTTTTAASSCINYTYTDTPANISGLEVRYRSCITGEIVTESVSAQISIDNGDGTFTYIICVDQSSSYATPVCVESGVEVVCSQSWVMGGSCGGGTTTTTAAPTTTTTTNSGASNFFVQNINGTGQIDDVDNGGGAYFYFVSNGSFPLTSGQSLDGVSSSLTNANIRVFVSNTSSGGCLVLYINTTPIDSLVVPNDGNYTFNNITYGTGDNVQIKYTNGACP